MLFSTNDEVKIIRLSRLNHFIKGLNASREVARREARSADDIAVRQINGLTEGKITDSPRTGSETSKTRFYNLPAATK